jgi:hypothetical protein
MHVKLNCGGEREAKDPHKAPAAAKSRVSRPRLPRKPSALKEIDELIALYRDRRRTSRDVKRLALGHVEDLNRKIAELAAIRNVLLELALKCRGDDRPECPILDELGSGASSVSDPIASGTTDQVKQ